MRIARLITSGFCIAVLGVAQDGTAGLLRRLSEGPLDVGILWRLEAQATDPQVLPALLTAFEARTEKKEKQQIAATLLRIGEKSDRYFDYLAAFAREAVEDRTPLSEYFDRNGRAVRGKFSAEFENWCAQHNKNPLEIAAKQFLVYPEDVKILAEVEDSRAISLFRHGLESNNPLVIAYSVQGLGRLNDITAIPLISSAADRIPPGGRTVIGGQLPWYFHPDAERLFERLIPERSTRDYLRRSVQVTQIDTIKRAQGRRETVRVKQ